jgi:hypothetical protein
MKVKDAGPTPTSKGAKIRNVPERKPSQYTGVKLAGLDQGYTRHSCAAPKPNTSSKKRTA